MMRYLAGAYSGFAAAIILTTLIDVGEVVPLIPLVGVCILLSAITAWWST